jgi:hypothetical protein
LAFVAAPALDELVEVFAHGVLVQSGHRRQRRDRHGPGLCGEVFVDEGNRRTQLGRPNGRLGPERCGIAV